MSLRRDSKRVRGGVGWLGGSRTEKGVVGGGGGGSDKQTDTYRQAQPRNKMLEIYIYQRCTTSFSVVVVVVVVAAAAAVIF